MGSSINNVGTFSAVFETLLPHHANFDPYVGYFVSKGAEIVGHFESRGVGPFGDLESRGVGPDGDLNPGGLDPLGILNPGELAPLGILDPGGLAPLGILNPGRLAPLGILNPGVLMFSLSSFLQYATFLGFLKRLLTSSLLFIWFSLKSTNRKSSCFVHLLNVAFQELKNVGYYV